MGKFIYDLHLVNAFRIHFVKELIYWCELVSIMSTRNASESIQNHVILYVKYYILYKQGRV